MDEYDSGYYDALKQVYEHTYGDNYKLSAKDKMQELMTNLMIGCSYEHFKASFL